MPIQWLTTDHNPRARRTGWDAGNTGWKLHAVEAGDLEKFSEIGGRTALCGLRPRWGWSLDLFVDEKCKRCEKKVVSPT
jgi:hypothetical protein